MAIIVGDVHGCFNTLEKLLSKLPDDEIFLVGDLIDRGPRSKEVIEFMIEHPEIKCVKGNHEEMACDVLSNSTLGKVLTWTDPRNGGQATLDSYGSKGDRCISEDIPEDHKKYMNSLPTYLIKGDLFISHAGYCGYDFKNKKDVKDIYTWNKERSLLWYRGNPKKVILEGNDYFHIFGHSPVPGAEIGEYYANVDTGACFCDSKDEGYGILTAIQFPSMKIYTQEHVD